MKKQLNAFLLATAFAASFALPSMLKADEPVTLSVHAIGGEPAKLAEVQAAINEKLASDGIQVEYHYHDWGVYGDDMSRMISSGEEWDVAFGSPISGYQEYAQNGNFAYLNDLLEQHAPKLKEYIPQSLWDGVSFEGQIYGVPALKDSAAAQYWVIDTAVAEKAGVDIKTIKTMEDLDAVMPQLKEAIADEPGRYPFVLANDGINSMLCEYEFNNQPFNVKFGTTEVINLYKQEDVVAKFKLLREWKEKGYINPDANQKTSDQLPKGAEILYSAQGWDGAEAIWGNGSGHPVTINLRYGPVLTGDSIRGSFMIINAGSSKQEAAIKYLERVNTDPEIRNLLAYGREGVEYEIVKEAKGSNGEDVTFEPVDGVDNVIRRLGEKDKDGSVDNGYNVPAYSQGGFEYLHIWLNEDKPEDTDPKQFKTIVSQVSDAEASKLLGFVFNQEPVESQIAACNATVEKYYANLMTGNGDKPVEEMLSDMYEDLDNSGLQAVMDEMQKQIDNYLVEQGGEAQ
ncbi:MAG: extracellular solute-binding protein [Eubacteriales bacterium]|nr:extracellular solute-binding protein [Eubacteriales bacterium]